MLILAYLIFGFFSYSMIGLVAGVILLDVGLQSSHIANQTLVFSLNPQARNRLNTVYMFIYFMGGAAGTYIASQAWRIWRWDGVVAVGLVFSSLALAVHLLYSGRRSQATAENPEAAS